jgi:hypothetical protein
MAKKTKRQTAIEEAIAQQAIAIVDQERTNWEDAVVYVTEKVGFRMRELVRIMRKNYWGVFDYPVDKATGREKIWIGLVMSTVDTWVKNSDLSSKDLGFIAKTPDGYQITDLTRLVVKEYLDKMFFGEILDADIPQVLIDGTLVWKTWEERGPEGPIMKRTTVDLLNCYIDPSEQSIQTAYRFTERSIMTPDEIRGMTGWKNTEGLTGSQILNKIDGSQNSSFDTKSTGNFRDVYEMWGKMPKWLVTGEQKAEDAWDEIDGHIIVSGLQAGNVAFHLAEENKRKDDLGCTLKPYEELRVSKISGRWYGLGIAERLLALQEYLNTIVNIRINRSYISQLGLFKIKKGAGITAQMLNKLPSNGAIQVQSMDDVTQMQVSDIGQSSYNDEDVVKYWAQQMSSAQPVSSGETLPSSATATAAAISNTNAKTGYTKFKEGIGMFLQRWMNRHALPIIAKGINEGDIVRLMSDDESFKRFVDSIALANVEDALEKGNVIPSEEELLAAIENETERLRKSETLMIESVQEIVASDVEAKFKVTNEDLDTSVTVANLIQIMQIAPEYRESVVRQLYDLMGLPQPKAPKQAQMAQGAPTAPAGSMMDQQMASLPPNPVA